MSYASCPSCRALGNFSGCLCRFGVELQCSEKPTCPSCQDAHQRIFGPFFRALLKSNRVERSNSIRIRLLTILRETVAYYGTDEIRERRFCLDQIPSAFEENGTRFRAGVLAVADALPCNATIGATLREKIFDLAISRKLEQFVTAMSERDGITASR
jgi:hypothetical protein